MNSVQRLHDFRGIEQHGVHPGIRRVAVEVIAGFACPGVLIIHQQAPAVVLAADGLSRIFQPASPLTPSRGDVKCGHIGGHMKTATVREFRDQATKLLKEEEPVIVTRRGKIVGFFLPAAGKALPLEIKKELFYTLTTEIRATMKEQGIAEEAVLADFEKARKARRRR
jgi:hypothetical protein